MEILYENVFLARLVSLEGKDRESAVEKVKDPSFKGAFSKTLTGALYLNQLSYNTTLYKICREPYMTLPIVIYVRKDFFLLNEINDKILLFQAAGLIEHWHSKSVDSKFLNIVEPTVLKKLNLKHLYGTFQIWFGGCIVAGIAFVVELVIDKSQRNNLFRIN